MSGEATDGNADGIWENTSDWSIGDLGPSAFTRNAHIFRRLPRAHGDQMSERVMSPISALHLVHESPMNLSPKTERLLLLVCG